MCTVCSLYSLVGSHQSVPLSPQQFSVTFPYLWLSALTSSLSLRLHYSCLQLHLVPFLPTFSSPPFLPQLSFLPFPCAAVSLSLSLRSAYLWP